MHAFIANVELFVSAEEDGREPKDAYVWQSFDGGEWD